MKMNEILEIRKALALQGFTVSRMSSGIWVIRGMRDLPVAIIGRDADRDEWLNSLMRLKDLGCIIWPPPD